MNPAWLDWMKRLQAIAQTGLTFAADPYDIERYEEIREIAAEIAAGHSGASFEHIGGLFANQSGYATPKVDVRGAVFRDDMILLVKERSDGGWTLPGGWADVGDSPGDAVVREIAEESGYLTHAVKLLALYDRNKHGHPPYPFHAYKLFFLCELLLSLRADRRRGGDERRDRSDRVLSRRRAAGSIAHAGDAGADCAAVRSLPPP